MPGGKTFAAESGSEGRIIKWVDEKGVTHYGDTMPAQAAGRDNSVINSQGRVVKRNQAPSSNAGANPDQELQKQNAEQARQDKNLRAAYTTVQEIDLVRDRNLQMDEMAVKGLEQRKSSAQNRLEMSKKFAADFAKRKKPVPTDLLDEIKQSQAEIANIDAQMAERRAAMEATRQRYENDRRRFLELNPSR
ncbi:MAG TPA: DUF4124 domain-containing protein [Methylophilaceae bacterium]|nr:DUF4124 domain-containing protein [Methylophilaceae bacterium]